MGTAGLWRHLPGGTARQAVDSGPCQRRRGGRWRVLGWRRRAFGDGMAAAGGAPVRRVRGLPPSETSDVAGGRFGFLPAARYRVFRAQPEY